MKSALRSSLHPELASGVLGVGSEKVESRVIGASSCPSVHLHLINAIKFSDDSVYF